MDSSQAAAAESQRLQRARLRLAEAQGKIPRGISEISETSLSNVTSYINADSLKDLQASSSRVREISWRVAEPAVKYDPDEASRTLFTQPVRWITRNIQIFAPLTIFTIKVLMDLITKKEEENRKIRAEEILNIIR